MTPEGEKGEKQRIREVESVSNSFLTYIKVAIVVAEYIETCPSRDFVHVLVFPGGCSPGWIDSVMILFLQNLGQLSLAVHIKGSI